MNGIWAIAKNSFREAIRDRIFVGLIGFGIAYVLTIIFMAKISLGEALMIKSFGLAGVYLFGLLTTVFLGSSIIYRELDRRTAYFILSKPIPRKNLILGKFLGLCLAITLNLALMSILYLIVIASQGLGFDLPGLISIAYELGEMILLSAFLTFLSVIVSPLPATIIATMAVLAGHSLHTVMVQAQHVNGITLAFVSTVYYLFPNLDKFDLRSLAAHGVLPGLDLAWPTGLYLIAYTSFLLILAVIFLRRKEL